MSRYPMAALNTLIVLALAAVMYCVHLVVGVVLVIALVEDHEDFGLAWVVRTMLASIPELWEKPE